MVARRNIKVAENTSNLDTENEEEIGKRKRRQRKNQIVCSDDESPAKRSKSKHAAPPNFKKSLSEKIREKLSSSNGASSSNKITPQAQVKEVIPLEVCAIVHNPPEPSTLSDREDGIISPSKSVRTPPRSPSNSSGPEHPFII